jgi:putative nucleotidyltransferase with HDIG domain
MTYIRAKLIRKLIEFFNDDDRRIEHALRVLYHAENCVSEYPACDRDILIAAALLHDVGIKESEEKLGYNTGKTQEKYGPAIAKRILDETDFPKEKIHLTIDIISRHHSPENDDCCELKILKRADAVVNKTEKV